MLILTAYVLTSLMYRLVIKWSSEEYIIPYISPVDNRPHRYYPDFYVKVRNADNIVEEWIVEVHLMTVDV